MYQKKSQQKFESDTGATLKISALNRELYSNSDMKFFLRALTITKQTRSSGLPHQANMSDDPLVIEVR